MSSADLALRSSVPLPRSQREIAQRHTLKPPYGRDCTASVDPSVDRGTAGPSGQGPSRPTVRGRSGAHPSAIGETPRAMRREDPMNTVTTSAADSAVMTSHDAELDAATVSSLVHIRELGPGDGDVVDVVFAGLSPRS